MTILEGRIIGRRAADLLKVTDCRRRDCVFRGGRDCLIGHEIEGRW
jgi:hypothetical protein